MTSQIIDAHREIMSTINSKDKTTNKHLTEALTKAGNLLAEVLDSKDHKAKVQR